MVAPQRVSGVPRRWVLPATFLLLAEASVSAVRLLGTDPSRDLAAELGRLAHDVLAWRWSVLVVLLAAAGAHYVAAAVATRAVSGCRLPVLENIQVQLAASAANRITPAGAGGGVVNARYFSRRGLNTAAAAGAVLALGLLGGLSDVLVFATLVAAGVVFGLAGTAHQVPALASRALALLGPLRSYWTVVLVAVALLALVAVFRRRGVRLPVRDLLAPVSRLARRPGALVSAGAASGATTLILALAFAAAPTLLGGSRPHVAVGALLVGYMIAAAAGGALPIPGGAGSTEAALIGVLVVDGWPAGGAVEIVIIFRVITFWAPAVIGLLLTRRLRRSGAL